MSAEVWPVVASLSEEIGRGTRSQRRGLRMLCWLAVAVTGVVAVAALLAATYTHQGSSPMSTAGAIGQLVFALLALGLALTAVKALAAVRPQRVLALTGVALFAAVAWVPLVVAVWRG